MAATASNVSCAKVKQFRPLATRYDKLAKTFLAAVHLVAAFLILRNS